jgi:hypothetical protein
LHYFTGQNGRVWYVARVHHNNKNNNTTSHRLLEFTGIVVLALLAAYAASG